MKMDDIDLNMIYFKILFRNNVRIYVGTNN